MITVVKAGLEHIQGIIRVCSEGYRNTYNETHSKKYIERTISEFYNAERVAKEIQETDRHWNGWYAAIGENGVAGAGGGGMTAEHTSELFVLYLDPAKRRQGIGTLLLNAITEEQIQTYGAQEQWVSVDEQNQKGIPFYKAKGFIV
ncbi:GNAT family N-acetyltransferase [Metabacillus sp. FJAT-52054]|uniref:GNAT family N-acetyltransferase n=2 Tax=Bacillaceae TaxID=186817 RepID=A0ABZ2NKN2_9BACI